MIGRAIDFILFAAPILLLASCGMAVVGTAVHCIATDNPHACPQIVSGGKCVAATLGCP